MLNFSKIIVYLNIIFKTYTYTSFNQQTQTSKLLTVFMIILNEVAIHK